MRTITYKVQCPRDKFAVYEMTVVVATLPDGSLFPSPCNGCDMLDGSKACHECVESLFKKSLKDPSMRSYSQPIVPYQHFQ